MADTRQTIQLDINGNDNSAGALRNAANNLQGVETSAREASTALGAMDANATEANAELQRMATHSQTVSSGFNGVSGAVGNAWTQIKGFIGAYVGIQTAEQVVKMSDDFKDLESKIKLSTDSSTEFNQVMTGLNAISANTGSVINDNASLYSRMSGTLKEAGYNSEQLLLLTDLVAKSLKVSGATTAEASSFTQQFAQAMGSGVLRGEEFNAMMDSNVRFAKALADGLGVPLGALKQMAEDGKLTADVIYQAVTPSFEKLTAESDAMGDKVSSAWVKVKNGLEQWIGKADQANGITDKLIAGMNGFTDSLTDTSSATNVFTKALSNSVNLVSDFFDVLSESVTANKAVEDKLNKGYAELWETIADGVNATDDLIQTQDHAAATHQKVAEKLAEISKQTGVTVNSQEDLNQAIADGKLVFNQATGQWQVAGEAIKSVGVAAEKAGVKIAALNTDLKKMSDGELAKAADAIRVSFDKGELSASKFQEKISEINKVRLDALKIELGSVTEKAEVFAEKNVKLFQDVKAGSNLSSEAVRQLATDLLQTAKTPEEFGALLTQFDTLGVKVNTSDKSVISLANSLLATAKNGTELSNLTRVFESMGLTVDKTTGKVVDLEQQLKKVNDTDLSAVLAGLERMQVAGQNAAAAASDANAAWENATDAADAAQRAAESQAHTDNKNQAVVTTMNSVNPILAQLSDKGKTEFTSKVNTFSFEDANNKVRAVLNGSYSQWYENRAKLIAQQILQEENMMAALAKTAASQQAQADALKALRAKQEADFKRIQAENASKTSSNASGGGGSSGSGSGGSFSGSGNNAGYLQPVNYGVNFGGGSVGGANTMMGGNNAPVSLSSLLSNNAKNLNPVIGSSTPGFSSSGILVTFEAKDGHSITSSFADRDALDNFLDMLRQSQSMSIRS